MFDTLVTELQAEASLLDDDKLPVTFDVQEASDEV